jgi:molybdopterin synthase sulfur carrier subunit
MTIRVLYFAGLREALGQSAEELVLPDDVCNVGALRARLCARGGVWSALESNANLRVAVNQKMADTGVQVHDGDEVAFFPPVTGG